MSPATLLDLLTLRGGPGDRFEGSGPRYPWGGLYGGQIVAQALVAATLTVDDVFACHSLRAYFIRRGDHEHSVDYEVDRTRDGRSYCTRRVIARQGARVILNLEASFSRPESTDDIETVEIPRDLPRADGLAQSSWSPYFDRAFVPPESLADVGRAGRGRAAAWLAVREDLGDRPDLWPAALVYLSDDLPTDAVVRAHPVGRESHEVLEEILFSASLDHTVWFHRPVRPDRWHLHDLNCQTFVGGRGLAIGHIFAEDGVHVATVAQEVLLRDRRDGPAAPAM